MAFLVKPKEPEKAKQQQKNKKVLDPQIRQMESVKSNPVILNESDFVKLESTGSNSDSFFKWIINALFSKENISLKTEYLNVNENFIGSKLEFLSKYGNMPYLNEFLDIFETKRVSLGRKGRKEILMALQKREEEIQQEKIRNLRGALGME
jgi:hypothetical protein